MTTATEQNNDSWIGTATYQPASVDKVDLAIKLGANIAEARIFSGKTQKNLADLLGTQQSNISRLENGSNLPSLPFLVKVADELETQVVTPTFASVFDSQLEDYLDAKKNTEREIKNENDNSDSLNYISEDSNLFVTNGAVGFTAVSNSFASAESPLVPTGLLVRT